MSRVLFLCSGVVLSWLAFAGWSAPGQVEKVDLPRAHDPRLIVERFTAAPDIVHPVGIVCDRKGRLLVIESHTHFRPKDYQGARHDRVRILEDTDGDGKADRFSTFFEGTQSTMDIALHPDGSIYLATRNEILRLKDSKGDGKADEQQRIVFLDTKGNYPHNGLSGLAFDSKGNLYFGLGENLGAAYKLIGSDGSVIADEGEGGNIFWCTAEGKKPRRVATGFWNPFGVCLDIFGRIFAVDNDADAMPPCRLVHVVEGGDYGYQYRYGRSGRHPFQAWNGQLAGTLPMVCGTGEGPCEVISYESDGLPPEYRGNLLVASWADHRIERYEPTEKGASVSAERKPFVQGGKDFRPVGIAIAPDGSLFVSDWVLSDYNLHGKGAIWRIRMREPAKPDRPTDPRRALLSADRSLREAAARQLATDEQGRDFLRRQLHHEDVRVRAAALTALMDADDRTTDPRAIAEKDAVIPLRALAARALVARGQAAESLADAKQPSAVRLEAVAALASRDSLRPLLIDPDPFLRHAAVQRLARLPDLLDQLTGEMARLPAPERVCLLLAWRASGRAEAMKVLPAFLANSDEEGRFLAAKWIADQKLDAFRPQVVEALKDPNLSVRLYYAFATALARIDGQDVNESRMADVFVTRLTDPNASAGLRVAALRLVPPSHKKLTLDVLAGLLKQEDAGVRLEAVRLLNEHPSPQRFALLLEAARNRQFSEALRAEAVVGLADQPQEHLDALLGFAQGPEPALRDESLRALARVKLTESQRELLEKVGKEHPASRALAARALGKPLANNRPKPDDTAAWLKRLEGPADADAGRRVFFQPRLANCSRCHRVDGRGQDIGPDLSGIGRTERRHLLESVLQPDLIIAPHYQTWSIATADGKLHTGMLVRTHLDEYTYINLEGAPFKLITRDIDEIQPLPKSIMPAGLTDLLTDQELRDLLAYLASRR